MFKIPKEGKKWVVWFCFMSPVVVPIAFIALIFEVIVDFLKDFFTCFKTSCLNFDYKSKMFYLAIKNSILTIREEWDK